MAERPVQAESLDQRVEPFVDQRLLLRVAAADTAQPSQ